MISNPKGRAKRRRGVKHLKAEGVQWDDAMRHAMSKPKPKDPWGPNKK